MICVALQYCPECAEKLTTPIDNKPLDPQFRLLLKCTIPYPDDDDEETSTVAGDEEETDLQKFVEKFAAVDERLGTLELQFNEKIQSLEAKLEQILSALTGPHPPFSHETGAASA